MKLWVVEREEFSGWECNGHWQTYIVAAENADDACVLIPKQSEHNSDNHVYELRIPNLDRLKKPRVIS